MNRIVEIRNLSKDYIPALLRRVIRADPPLTVVLEALRLSRLRREEPAEVDAFAEAGGNR